MVMSRSICKEVKPPGPSDKAPNIYTANSFNSTTVNKSENDKTDKDVRRQLPIKGI